MVVVVAVSERSSASHVTGGFHGVGCILCRMRHGKQVTVFVSESGFTRLRWHRKELSTAWLALFLFSSYGFLDSNLRRFLSLKCPSGGNEGGASWQLM